MSELSLSAAAARLSQAFALDGSTASREDLEIVRSAISRFLLARFRALGVDELLDVTDEAIERLLRESRRQGRQLDNAAGWLIVVAANRARDQLKGHDRDHPLTDEPLADDEVARLVDRTATVETVQRAVTHAIKIGDDICVRVITEWLDLARDLGSAPSSRVVGARCRCSHTSVNQALTRFRSYLPDL